MTDQEARARYVRAMAASTVWIRQRIDGQWEAINWEGKVVCFGRFRSTTEYEVKQMAAHAINNIYAVTTIVAPNKRQPKRRPKGMRRF